MHVGADALAHRGDGIDEGDLRRQEGVRRVLDRLRRGRVGDDDRRVDAAVERGDLLGSLAVVAAHDDPVGLEEVGHSRALAEELGVGDDLHVGPAEDPLDELARIYFDAIPDAFRRPNTRLYEWLGREVSARSVRGIILRRYPVCDLWHAELERLRTWSDVPVLDLDVETGDEGEASRTLARIEAFLEMLR